MLNGECYPLNVRESLWSTELENCGSGNQDIKVLVHLGVVGKIPVISPSVERGSGVWGTFQWCVSLLGRREKAPTLILSPGYKASLLVGRSILFGCKSNF